MPSKLSFNKSYNETKESGLPDYPDTCGVVGCNNETNFVMMKVSSGAGIQYKVASDVLNKPTKPYTLRDGYNYIGWFVRCGKCLQDGIRDKKAKLKLAGEHKNYV